MKNFILFIIAFMVSIQVNAAGNTLQEQIKDTSAVEKPNKSESPKMHFWFETGFGYYYGNESGSLIFFGCTSVKGTNVVTLKCMLNQEYIFGDDKNIQKIFDVGLMYGTVLLNENHTLVTLSAGISYLTTTVKTHSVIGFPAELKFAFATDSPVGINVIVFGNYNEAMPFGGIALGLRFGK